MPHPIGQTGLVKAPSIIHDAIGPEQKGHGEADRRERKPPKESKEIHALLISMSPVFAKDIYANDFPTRPRVWQGCGAVLVQPRERPCRQPLVAATLRSPPFAAQGDGPGAQGDACGPQGDTSRAQGDTLPRKATFLPQDCVTV